VHVVNNPIAVYIVTPPSPAANDANDSRYSDKYPGHTKKPYTTGRPADPGTEAVLELCYDELKKGRTRAQVLDQARREFPDNAPSNEANVRNYARRWAERFTPRLPLDW
jgi:hypothetical protein